MARAAASDFLHSMRFHVSAAETTSRVQLLPLAVSTGGVAQAGFSSCTTPQASVQVAEYREGHYVYTRKQPGIPTVEDISMSRGVTFRDTEFWNWLRVVIEGGGDYRTTLYVKQFNRSAMPGTFGTRQSDNSSQKMDLDDTEVRTYEIFQAFPTTHKVASDLDSTSSEISIMELGIAYESFEILLPAVATPPPG